MRNNLFSISKNKVYIFAPAGKHTGGPELLHQLGAELRANGVEAFMCYYPNFHPSPVHKNYKKYNVPFVRFIADSPENVIVVPEAQVPRALKFKNARVCMWWLSVDNFFYNQNKYKNEPSYLRFLKYGEWKSDTDWEKAFNKFFYHLYQSEYANIFLKSKGISDARYLSDYLSPIFLRDAPNFPKEDYVCYNPKKGTAFTKKLLASARDIKFVALENMTSEQVKEALARAKVYIDFGEHPGKDRIPREAAFLGACVIVGKKGSAANDVDVLIPRIYKFDEDQIPDILSRIKDCFANFDENKRQFDTYVEKIKAEQKEFSKDVKEVFGLS